MPEYKNYKEKGERGQSIAIGEFAKFGVDVALPMSDNLPIDLILIQDNNLYKAQVKTSERQGWESEGSICFKLTSNNWQKKTTKWYTAEEVDILILCDLQTIYLLTPDDFLGRTTFTIRQVPPKNNQKKSLNMAEDYVISDGRIRDVLQ